MSNIPHDNIYKNLFSHPQMVEDLLRGFVQQDWVNELDFSTLEKVPGSYVSEDLRNREDDLVWRVKSQRKWIYIYLLLEFQSSEDKFMAVRILVYLGLLYQDLIKRNELEHGKLPPILPVVLYNGIPRWQAATEISDLIHPAPEGLAEFCPQLRYLLLDERSYSHNDLSSLKNLVAALFRLENHRTPHDIIQVMDCLVEWLAEPQQVSLRRAFNLWLKQGPLHRFPDIHLLDLTSLKETRIMLTNAIDNWMAEVKQEMLEKGIERGIEKGIERGIEKGIEQGYAKAGMEMLLKQLQLKFGVLPVSAMEQVLHMSTPEIMVCMERILTAERLEDVLLKAQKD
jgi:predicted transposase/invertase (TIGR01784 family)